MIMDKNLEFASKTALSLAGTGRALVGNVIDLEELSDVGSGQPLYLVLQVDTAVASGGSATVVFELSSDSSAAISTDGTTETIHVATAAIPKATLVQGYTLVIPLPLENPAYKRFLGIVANVAVAALTAGKVNAFLTLDPRRWRAFPDALN